MNANLVSTAALAYLGDCVLELCVRSLLVECGITRSGELNAEALGFVRADAQSEAVKLILPVLTEEEQAIFRRGRNAGHTNTPKSATTGQYRAATGMEALFGWLYINQNQKRIDELFALAYPAQTAGIERKRK